MCFCTRSCLCLSQKSCRGKERMDRDVASNGRPSSCMGFSGGAGSTVRTLMRKWDGKGKKKRGLQTKVGHFRGKKCTARRKINPRRTMCDERGENGLQRQQEREWVRRRKGMLTENGGPWGDGWSELSGMAIRQTTRGGEKKRGDKHTPQKSELQRMLKMRGSLWKKGKVCALVNIVWAEIWKSGEPQQYLLNGWKLHRDIILIKTHYLHPVIVQRRCSKTYRNPFTESLQDGSILQINKQSERLNGLLWLNFDDTCGILAVNQ